jgi:hypothetical protein
MRYYHFHQNSAETRQKIGPTGSTAVQSSIVLPLVPETSAKLNLREREEKQCSTHYSREAEQTCGVSGRSSGSAQRAGAVRRYGSMPNLPRGLRYAADQAAAQCGASVRWPSKERARGGPVGRVVACCGGGLSGEGELEKK